MPVNVSRGALVAFVPAATVATYYLVLGRRTADDFTMFIVVLGFSVTLTGSLLSVIALGKRIANATWTKTVAIAIAAAASLLALVSTLPSWPFADVGLIVSWLIASTAVTAASIWVCDVGMPDKSLERSRER